MGESLKEQDNLTDGEREPDKKIEKYETKRKRTTDGHTNGEVREEKWF